MRCDTCRKRRKNQSIVCLSCFPRAQPQVIGLLSKDAKTDSRFDVLDYHIALTADDVPAPNAPRDLPSGRGASLARVVNTGTAAFRKWCQQVNS